MAKQSKTNKIFQLYNPGHNILELYNVLLEVRVATSKTKHDIHYNKVGARVTSRVAERIKLGS